MNLIRLIAIIIIVWLVVRMVRAWLDRRFETKQREQRPALHTGDMVKCEVCGLHVPREEAEAADEHFYCGPEHRREALEHRKQ